jgi:hypothetical protein
MARITITNAVVSQYLSTKGFIVEETVFTKSGDEYKVKFSVWDAAPMPAIGAHVNVTGEFTARNRVYNAPSGPKTTIDRNINNAVVQVVDAPAVVPSAGAMTEELPF